MSAKLTLTVHGARGSMSVSGIQYRRFGGNTTSMHIPITANEHLILDAGTGLRRLQHTLGEGPHHFVILLSHYHWDHIQGLPLFSPLREPANSFTFVGAPADGMDVEKALSGAIQVPWFPASLEEASASKLYMEPHDFDVGPISLQSARLRHPQGVTAYRLDGPNRRIVFATDHEAGDEDADQRLVELARGADVLIHDGQYDDAEYAAKQGWGHSTPDAAVDAALAAGVSRLVLTSHDPDHDDAAVDDIVGIARRRFPLTVGAYEGMTLEL